MSCEFTQKAYAAYGVDSEAAKKAVHEIPISIHCWQGDDVVGLRRKKSATRR